MKELREAWDNLFGALNPRGWYRGMKRRTRKWIWRISGAQERIDLLGDSLESGVAEARETAARNAKALVDEYERRRAGIMLAILSGMDPNCPDSSRLTPRSAERLGLNAGLVQLCEDRARTLEQASGYIDALKARVFQTQAENLALQEPDLAKLPFGIYVPGTPNLAYQTPRFARRTRAAAATAQLDTILRDQQVRAVLAEKHQYTAPLGRGQVTLVPYNIKRNRPPEAIFVYAHPTGNRTAAILKRRILGIIDKIDSRIGSVLGKFGPQKHTNGESYAV